MYEALDEHRPAEIHRIAIYNTVMEMLEIGLDPVELLKGVSPHRITHAVEILEKLGMVTKQDGQVKVTDSGHFAPNFPLGIRNAAVLWRWIEQGLPLFPGIIATCLIDCYGPSYYWIPRRNRDQSTTEYRIATDAHKEKYFSEFVGSSDVETALNMWNTLMDDVGGYDAGPKAILTWTQENSINHKKLKEVLTISRQCINAANRRGLEVNVGRFTTAGVITKLKPILSDVYGDMVMFHKYGTFYTLPSTGTDFKLDSRGASSNLSLNKPPAVIGLITADIRGTRSTMHFLSFAIEADGVKFPAGAARTVPMTGIPRRTVQRRTAPPVAAEQTATLTAALDMLKGLDV